MSQIIDFFDGGNDGENRSFESSLAYSLDWMETCHDYIQWFFPLPEPSMFHPDAPILSEEEIQALQQDVLAQNQRYQNVMLLVDKFLYFLGILRTDQSFELSDGGREKIWLGNFNHNQFRMTRMLRFMCLIGLQTMARKLVAFLYDECNAKQAKFNIYWQEAVEP